MLDQIELDEPLYLENGNWTTHGQDEECERDHNPYEKNDIHRLFCPPSLHISYIELDSIKFDLVSCAIGGWEVGSDDKPPGKHIGDIGY